MGEQSGAKTVVTVAIFYRGQGDLDRDIAFIEKQTELGLTGVQAIEGGVRAVFDGHVYEATMSVADMRVPGALKAVLDVCADHELSRRAAAHPLMTAN